ncbi:hypothetical protein Bca52824_088402 [Brassica carinata]|uniref:Uncharacterized protein n=1 Tax=Brassica carinata TaxID=52824 RepID=A0A8X7TP62_BRACI|nr:hypothetical protein Bca52824_088402 [Brassica carinata]
MRIVSPNHTYWLEHVDEVLRSARLSGYCISEVVGQLSRVSGEPPPLDNAEVEDWLPRFVVLQAACLFFYLLSADLSPQDSILLADIVEVGSHHCFYILTRQGLRFQCSSASKSQVNQDMYIFTVNTHVLF